ncbi:MAG: tetratricopeptide repeat protein [Sedimentisphaerales bacterium]|nr:tetratricopeptide repeat protein [Sedimentisphaerales bacterium]
MTSIKKTLIFCLFLLVVTTTVEAKLPKEQVYSLYNQANETFRQANSTKDPDQAKRLYEKAILNFEKIIEEGQIENVKLYYNLANAYFLQGQLGKAILNYRKAIKIDDSDENIQKNLAFACSKRIDKIAVKTEKRVLQTLFFWHYDFSLKTKFLLTCVFWGAVCICITAIIWLDRSPAWTISTTIFVILMLCFLGSVAIEYRTHTSNIGGVITAKEVIARQGDGENYPISFKGPLHEGTEFDLLESRPGWFHIKLSDDSDGWILNNAAELI